MMGNAFHSDSQEYLASWASQFVRAVAPIATPIVSLINPAAGAAVAVGTNALWPGATTGQNPSNQATANADPLVAPAAPAVAPAAPVTPAASAEWINGVPNALVVAGGGVLVLAAVAAVSRGGRK